MSSDVLSFLQSLGNWQLIKSRAYYLSCNSFVYGFVLLLYSLSIQQVLIDNWNLIYVYELVYDDISMKKHIKAY